MTDQLTDITSGSRDLHVVGGGAGAPALLFLHGMGTSAASWRRCMQLLADHRRVVAPDLIGHGTSPVPDDPAQYTRDRTLDDIDELMSDPALSLTGGVVLVGHSLGGYLALAHAATRPGAAVGIVVLNTGPGYRDADKREAWNERSRRNAHRFGVPVQAADLNLQEDSVVMDRLTEIDVPTSVVITMRDHTVPTRRQVRLFEGIGDVEAFRVDGDHAAVASLPDRFVPSLLRAVHSVVERADVAARQAAS